jgi:hypothetical protein
MEQHEQRPPPTRSGATRDYSGLVEQAPNLGAAELEVHHPRAVRVQPTPRERIAGNAQPGTGEG